MKWRVDLFIGGRVFSESVIANNKNDAEAAAIARNPTAKVISSNPNFL